MSIDKPGLTARGKLIPQNKEEWEYLANLYEKAFREEQSKNSAYRIQIQHLKDKLNRYKNNESKTN